MVAEELAALGGPRAIKNLTFNLSQYQSADELAAAFHLVRDCVLGGEIPLVFFDQFDTTLNQFALGWLRYFLSPMQDAEFLDRGAPHPIGQAIFVFAGGTAAATRSLPGRSERNTPIPERSNASRTPRGLTFCRASARPSTSQASI